MSPVSLPSHHPYYSRPLSYQNVSDRLNRLTHRHLFLRSLVPAIGNLDYGFMVPDNASLSLLGDLKEISVAINATEKEDWITASIASPFVRESRINEKGLQANIELVFQDESKLTIRLLTEFLYRGKPFLSLKMVLDNAMIHRDGIKIANINHVVEYHWLRSHAVKRKFPIDFRPLLLGQCPDSQIQAADYICHKYRLGTHRLFHLLTHTPTYRKSIDKRMGLESNRNMNMAGFASLFQLFVLSPSS